MSADTKGSADVGAVRTAVRSLRGRVAAVERALALGVLALVVKAFLDFAVAFKIILPLFGDHALGAGVGSQILEGLVAEGSLLAVLPGLAWLLGLVFEGSSLAVGVGAAFFVEVFELFVAYLSSGSGLLLDRPAYLGTRILVTLGAGILAALAFRHGRAWIDAKERARRRVPPAAPAVSEDAPGGDGTGSGTSR